MKEVKIEAVLVVYDSLEKLPEDIQKLMQLAVEARNTAYSPYSKFNVGASILLDNGEVVSGSNQENASYPSGLCAERTAIFYAGAKYPKAKMLKMALTASSQNQVTNKPIPPCGACRQSIAEYEIKQKQPIEIYFMGAKGKVVKSKSLANLLPLVFESSVL
ncbi:MAG: cytidine deaminase [Winogradskyella sp.]|uniref:cytidine deaminase n=1 Tax=Winogradskyella sp. TaxID=1883156 RepID=UPI0017D5E5DA|nr:cytidine deaminase [Winogradskyella sp.]MBT8244056.1 cytidine deaminase [Winogradskyella sp.]NNK23506.1 cytidine deaminase [Winogradskyella sp.]